MRQIYSKTYPNCFRLIPEDKWQELVDSVESIEFFPDILLEKTAELQLEEYLGELARLELLVCNLKKDNVRLEQYTDKLLINPSIQLVENTWKNLSLQIDGDAFLFLFNHNS